MRKISPQFAAPLGLSVEERRRQRRRLICSRASEMIIALTLTYLNVNDSVAVHPHGKHGVCEHHSDLIQQLLLQRGTVEFLQAGGWGVGI